MSKAEISPDYKQMKLLCLCERCNSVCTLKHPALNGAVLLIFGGPFFFGLAFCALWHIFPTNLGFAYALLPGLGAAAVTYLVVLVLGRFIHRYVPLHDRAA
jgi:multidrug transporter EmrE-like cation transporter